MDKIEVSKEKWVKVARAVGDKNPIHYLEDGAICPGVYLLSDAEKRAREDGKFKLPINIKANFMSWVYDGDLLFLDKNYSEEKAVLTYLKDLEKVIKDR